MKFEVMMKTPILCSVASWTQDAGFRYVELNCFWEIFEISSDVWFSAEDYISHISQKQFSSTYLKRVC